MYGVQVLLIGLLAGAPMPDTGPTPAVPPVPRIIVSVDNGATRVTEGGPVEYVIRVRNRTAVMYRDVLVAELLPRSLTYQSADEAPDVTRTGEIQWRRDLPANGQVVMRVRGVVGKPTAGHPRLTTTACVRAAAGGPLVCDSDSDVIGPPPPLARALVLSVSGAAFTAAILLLGWLLRRRRRTS